VFCFYVVKLHVILFISSQFLFVIGDDRVTCHTRVDDFSGDVVDA